MNLIKHSFYISAFILTTLTIFSISAYAVNESSLNDKLYLEMVESSKSMPENYDFSALRELYKKTSFFNPYGTFYKKDVHALFDKYKAGEPGAGDNLITYLKQNFPYPEVQSRFMANYNSMGRTDLVKFHEWATKGLSKVLLHSGNGVDAAHAFKVIHISEEYLVARQYIDGRPSQSLRNSDGRVYDVLTGKEKGTGKEIDIWFDITDVFAKAPVPE